MVLSIRLPEKFSDHGQHLADIIHGENMAVNKTVCVGHMCRFKVNAKGTMPVAEMNVFIV